MSETAPAGSAEAITRTATGEIAPTPAATTPTEVTPSPEKPVEPAKDGKTLLTSGKPDAAAGPPEKYEFKVPDGFTLDETVSKEAGELFKGMGLTQEHAQSLIDFYATKAVEASNAPYKTYSDMRAGWVDAVKADPEIGGKLPEVKLTVARAIDGLGDPKLAADFREAMDLTGAGDNPAFIKAFYKLAQKVAPGTHVAAGGPSTFGQARPGGAPGSAAKAMFPNLP